MRAQRVVRLVVSSFAVQMQIEGRKQRRKTVGIFELHVPTSIQFGRDPVQTQFPGDLRGEQPLRVLLDHRHAFIR
jgi:hypothetical protein